MNIGIIIIIIIANNIPFNIGNHCSYDLFLKFIIVITIVITNINIGNNMNMKAQLKSLNLTLARKPSKRNYERIGQPIDAYVISMIYRIFYSYL